MNTSNYSEHKSCGQVGLSHIGLQPPRNPGCVDTVLSYPLVSGYLSQPSSTNCIEAPISRLIPHKHRHRHPLDLHSARAMAMRFAPSALRCSHPLRLDVGRRRPPRLQRRRGGRNPLRSRGRAAALHQPPHDRASGGGCGLRRAAHLLLRVGRSLPQRKEGSEVPYLPEGTSLHLNLVNPNTFVISCLLG